LQISRGVFFLLLFFSLINSAKIKSKDTTIFFIIYLLGIYSAILSIAVQQPVENIVGTIRLTYPALVGLATYILVSRNMLSERTLRLVAWYWLLAYFSSQLFALFSGKTIYNSMYAASGLGSGGSAADALIFLIPFFLLSERLHKWDLLAICMTITASALTMRRTAILGVFLALFFGVLARTLKRGGSIAGKTLTLLFFFCLLLGFNHALHSTGWGEEFSLRLADKTGSGRNFIWAQGVEHLGERGFLLNILGEGEGSYPQIMLKKIGFSVGSHNGWLNLVVAYGIVGVAFYLAFFSQLWRLLQESRKLPGSSLTAGAALTGGILLAETTQGFLLSPAAVSAYVLIGFLLAQNQIIARRWRLQPSTNPGFAYGLRSPRIPGRIHVRIGGNRLDRLPGQ